MKKGIIAVIIAVVVIGGGVGIYFLTQNKDEVVTNDSNSSQTETNINPSSAPATLEAFKAAFDNRAALNCTVENETGSSILATTNGWDKVRMSGVDENGANYNALYSDGYMYTWSDEGSFKIAMDFNKLLDDVSAEYGTDVDSDIQFSCGNPATANFDLPSGVEFIDFGNLY
jgi:hypothetical protein